ncbi:fumarate reductase subunit C [Celerinatantimonas yamalensis]|uniref:Fumarate reductase subunit C n=1 Tax=Celerinatantimonas yamalensis TaxID=559956 RepID=A0ABW9G585_9GAMM
MSIRQPYVRPIKTSWWLKNTFYIKYMIREGSSIATVIYSLVLLTGLFRLAQGPATFANWLHAMQSPVAIIFHLIALVWVLYHSVTWFELAPKAADIWLGGKRLADSVIIKAMYGLLIVVSVIVLAIVAI